MNEQDALLDAIAATPADDTPRLVYADWLQEHGEGEYAQFIRLQIERSRMKKKTPKRDRVLKAENAVWRKLKRKWSDLFSEEWGLRKEWFDRGFYTGVEHGLLRMELKTFLALSPSWWPRLPIRTVMLSTTQQSPDTLLDAPHLSRLTHLRLDRNQSHERTFAEEFVVRLFASERLGRLAELHFGRVALSQVAADAMLSAPFLNNLKILVVGYYALGHSGHLIMPDYKTYTHRPKRLDVPSGLVATALRKRLDELKPNYLVVPRGETS